MRARKLLKKHEHLSFLHDKVFVLRILDGIKIIQTLNIEHSYLFHSFVVCRDIRISESINKLKGEKKPKINRSNDEETNTAFSNETKLQLFISILNV